VKFNVGLQLGGKRESSDFSGNPHQSTAMSKRHITMKNIVLYGRNSNIVKGLQGLLSWGSTAGNSI
jgi:hypothetical protein